MTNQLPVDTTPASMQAARWPEPRLSATERAEALIGCMSLEEKVAQLTSVWAGADASGGPVAPRQAEMSDGSSWAATFDPQLIEEMAAEIGRAMLAAGVHQGLSPVLSYTDNDGLPVAADESLLTGLLRDEGGFTGAVVCVVAVGDRAGLFGRGTSGEGCDASDPYALSAEFAGIAGIVQAFFHGQLGGQALAHVAPENTNSWEAIR